MILVEVFRCGLFDAGDGDGLVAGEVFAEIAGVAGVLVVFVEGVGDATEAAEALEASDRLGEVDGAGGVELILGGAVGLELGDLLPEGGFKVFEFDVGLGGDGALDDGGELEGVVVAANGLCDLLFVDEDLVEAAGLGSAEDVGEECGVGVAGGVGARSEEGDAELREFDGVGDGGALLFGDGCGDDGDGVNLGAAGMGPKYLVRRALSLTGSKSPAMARLALLGV